MPRKKNNSNNLSAQQIQEQLAQMEADRKALEVALRERRTEELTGFAKEIKGQIIERGYTVEEVLSVLSKGRRRSVGGRPSGGYRQYVDPDNPANAYSRGPVPQWMKERMIASGLDPEDKGQREEFKASHLKQVA